MDLFQRAMEMHTDEAYDKKLYDHMRSKVEEIRSSASRMANESIWMTNIAYLAGVFGVKWDSMSRSYAPVNRPGAYIGSNQIAVNKILPTIQNRLSRLLKNPPKYDVIPESNDTEDKDAARLSLQVLNSLWDRLHINDKRIGLGMWTQQCGHGYVHCKYDTDAGEWLTDPTTLEKVRAGDPTIDIISPFEVFPDPMAKCFDDVLKSFLIHAKVRKLDYFRDRYGEKGALVKAEEVWLQSAQYENKINTFTTRGTSTSDDLTKHSAIELVKYEAPSKDHPEGRMIVGANGIILEDKPLPCGEIPFAMFGDTIIAGKYYPESIVTHLRPVQDQYNEVIRRRAEWVKKLLCGKYKVVRGSNLTEESLNDRTEVLEYDVVPNAPSGPEPIDIPQIPQYAYAEEDRLIGMFNDISGIGEVSKGTLPSASIPAIGMQLLTEQDDTRIGVIIQQHEYAWARVGKLLLKLASEYWKTPRKLKSYGPNLTWDVRQVKGDDLRGNVDVIVKPGSTLPGSKVLKRQEILNTYQQGLLGDPMDPRVREKVLGLLEFGETQGMWEKHAIVMNQITRGIKMIEQGLPPDVSEFDDHATWVDELNKLRMSEKYEKMPDASKQVLVYTMEMHLQEMANLADPGVDPIQAPLAEEEIINQAPVIEDSAVMDEQIPMEGEVIQ